jgi:hypothetical protein
MQGDHRRVCHAIEIAGLVQPQSKNFFDLGALDWICPIPAPRREFFYSIKKEGPPASFQA